MINPLIDNLDNLTTQEVEEKITDLQKKYFQTLFIYLYLPSNLT